MPCTWIWRFCPLDLASNLCEARLVQQQRSLYPAITPYESGFLRVSPTHELYWEQSGNPAGKPVLFLHGGPGGGTDPKHRRFFDPARYRIVLLDQRGCGRSRPHASLEDNNTWALVEDIERLRSHLRIDSWQVFGGSWGSTLALAYAQLHPQRVRELVLRGIFTFTQTEMDWFYGGGTAKIFPDAWADFVAAIPEDERDDLLAAYHRRLIGDDPKQRAACAAAWSLYECRVATLMPDPEVEAHCEDPGFTLPFARIECHYFVNHGFLEQDEQLLDGAERIAHIPTTIIHGRYDVICPVRNAWRLHRRMPGSKLIIVPDAGHSAFEPGIISALVEATDGWADR
ncbi:MAG: prolyl aminopeptidase [Myxococcales bacterium]|nr:prolyl aminopeptidase [Myxococcales bacterium]